MSEGHDWDIYTYMYIYVYNVYIIYIHNRYTYSNFVYLKRQDIRMYHLNTSQDTRWFSRRHLFTFDRMEVTPPAFERAMFSPSQKGHGLNHLRNGGFFRGYVNFTGVYWLIDFYVLKKITSPICFCGLPPSMKVARLSKRRWAKFFVGCRGCYRWTTPRGTRSLFLDPNKWTK